MKYKLTITPFEVEADNKEEAINHVKAILEEDTLVNLSYIVKKIK